MPKVVRKGDKNSAGGIAMSGDPTFIVDGRPVVVIGTPVSPHHPCPRVPIHCSAKTARGDKTYIVGNKLINVVGDTDTCGHPRVEGSSTFIVGG